jgi:hypothetical protein
MGLFAYCCATSMCSYSSSCSAFSSIRKDLVFPERESFREPFLDLKNGRAVANFCFNAGFQKIQQFTVTPQFRRFWNIPPLRHFHNQQPNPKVMAKGRNSVSSNSNSNSRYYSPDSRGNEGSKTSPLYKTYARACTVWCNAMSASVL